LLADVEAEAPDLITKAFTRRAERRTARARARLEGKPFEERVAELAAILDEDGYLADWSRQDDGSYRVVEHNCAILGVARRHCGACASEIDFLRAAMPDAVVDRVAHMLSGAHVCAYAIRPREPDADPA
jgi:DeoR family suf operon transcriptional repressor